MNSEKPYYKFIKQILKNDIFLTKNEILRLAMALRILKMLNFGRKSLFKRFLTKFPFI